MTDLTHDLAALDAALYMGPTHGPWHATKPKSHGTGVRGPAQVSLAWCGCAKTVGEEGYYRIGFEEAVANAHFIAACSPDRIRRLVDYIRALLEERDALEAENERLREALKDADNELDWLDEDMGARLPTWQGMLSDAEQFVRQKPAFSKYRGTVLENAVPVWIADFAKRMLLRQRDGLRQITRLHRPAMKEQA